MHATGCARIMLLRRCDDEDAKRENVRYAYPQHLCCWIGGHFTEPKEQNTQQSPELGRSKVLQLLHS
jgi:hypothetical protein